MREAPTLPGVPPAGVYGTWEVARLTGVQETSLNRIATACGYAPGSGSPLRWSWRDVQTIRIATAIENAGARDGLPTIAVAVFTAHADGQEPILAGWVAYRRGQIRYGATPSEAIGPLEGAVVAHLRIPKEHP